MERGQNTHWARMGGGRIQNEYREEEEGERWGNGRPI